MAKSGGDTHRIFDWSIPAFSSRTGLKTCPMAGSCAKFCYAQKGTYTWTPTKNAQENRLATVIDGTFKAKFSKEIEVKLKTATRLGQKLAIRLHSSGDIYSLDYLKTLIEIMNDFPTTHFYVYTKSVTLIKRMDKAGKLPANFTYVLSEGGKEDHKIDMAVDRHARIFKSLEELKAAGYVDASKDDAVAFLATSNKIGLIFH